MRRASRKMGFCPVGQVQQCCTCPTITGYTARGTKDYLRNNLPCFFEAEGGKAAFRFKEAWQVTNKICDALFDAFHRPG